VRTTKWQKQLPTTMQCRSHSRRRTIECLFVTAYSMDEYAEEKRTEKNLIVRSGISDAETTSNKRLRSTFCIEAIQTRSIARPLCDSRASCFIPCGGLSWLHVSFLLHVKYTVSYRIVTAHFDITINWFLLIGKSSYRHIAPPCADTQDLQITSK